MVRAVVENDVIQKTFDEIERQHARTGESAVTLEAVDDLWQTLRRSRDPIVHDVLFRKVQLEITLDRLAEAKRSAQALMSFARRAGSVHAEADGLLFLGKVALHRFQFEDAQAWFERAREAFRRAKSSHGVAQVERNLAELALRFEDHAAAREHLARALRGFRCVRDRVGITNAFTLRARLALFEGKLALALRDYHRALAEARAIRDRQCVGNAAIGIAELLLFRGAVPEARQYLRLAARSYERVGDRRGQGDALRVAAEAASRLGNAKEAERLARRALALCEEAGDLLGSGNTWVELGEILLTQGETDRVLDAYAQAITNYEAIGDARGLGHVRLARAFLHYQLGRDADADEDALAACAHGESASDRLGRANALSVRARVAMRRDEAATAAILYADAAALYRAEGDLIGLSDALVSRARALLRMGDTKSAALSVRAGIDVGRRSADPRTLANAIATRALVESARGDLKAALQTLHDARGLYVRHAAAWNVARLDTERAEIELRLGRVAEAKKTADGALKTLDGQRALVREPTTHADLVEQFAEALTLRLEAARRCGEWADVVTTMETYRGWTLRALAEIRRGSKSRSTVRLSLRSVLGSIEAATSDGSLLLVWYPPDQAGRLACLVAGPAIPPTYCLTNFTPHNIANPLNILYALAAAGDDLGWAEPIETLSATVLRSPFVSTYALTRDASARIRSLEHAIVAASPTRIRIVPHGAISLLPFEGLRLSSGASVSDGRSVVWHPHLHSSTTARAIPANGRRRALVVSADERVLPGAAREGARVVAELRAQGMDVEHIAGDLSFDVSTFGAAAARANRVHFATHATYDPIRPFASFIALGAGDGRDGGHQLTIRDLLAANLRGSVHLAACLTATADATRMFDEVSLATACLAAGAMECIATRWAIDDAKARDGLLRSRLAIMRWTDPQLVRERDLQTSDI